MFLNPEFDENEVEPYLGTRSARRLAGYIKHRIAASRCIWVSVDFRNFEKMTGYTIRTIRRAKNELADHDKALKFRTCCKTEGKGWQVLVALESSLKFDREPLYFRANGSKRNLRTSLPGIALECSEHGLSDEEASEDEIGSNLARRYKDRSATDQGFSRVIDPVSGMAQIVFNNSRPGDIAPINGGVSSKPAECFKHHDSRFRRDDREETAFSGNCDPLASLYQPMPDLAGPELGRSCEGSSPSRVAFGLPFPIEEGPSLTKREDATQRASRASGVPLGSAKLSRDPAKVRKLAFVVGRKLEFKHHETCKVRFSAKHAVSFAMRWLERGEPKERIERAYECALRASNTIARDMGTTFSASSTISKANELLQAAPY